MSDKTKENTVQRIKEVLETRMWEQLEREEGITKEDLQLVDLDIGFSPVIPFKGDNPCEVMESTTPGKYIIVHPLVQGAITAEELKIMRYRYLINRKNQFLHGL